ncbi:TRAF-interacting protein with FHA domain-containing protein A-like [Girardinichthys multiradiatus]|uniref:TRAF-interacting protein with FHA domain-containing protein A-like n=1 Tax=Girardinichthys multiradiatus TaxID=208333 RepID=UPI001FADE0F6|nr:TRAF-interacting protein with FHA domain-containing protein A-like [Girardinichthys multiradiatus]
MMSMPETLETEEDLLTFLHIKFYHPQQACKGLYNLLPLGTRTRHCADDLLRLGRDTQACTYSLADPRVSRKQLAINAYRTPHSTNLLFSIQNLSQRGRLSVNGSSLNYLERMDLPDKALIRFGEYEMLIIRESGEAKASFEVDLEVLPVPPSRETCTVMPGRASVMDTGLMYQSTAGLRELGPQETDETLICYS